MAYRVNEVYYTLQGEGAHTGRPAVFLRFSGCNLWTGREEDRGSGRGECARWCDTNFIGIDGPHGGRYSEPQQLADIVDNLWPTDSGGSKYVVCTGGEPLLQLDATLVESLKERGFEVAIETNGTLEPPADIDWICVSPKGGTKLVIRRGDELKLVYPHRQIQPAQFEGLEFSHFFLQPLDGPDTDANVQAVIDYCLKSPQWKLSLQTHKMIGIK